MKTKLLILLLFCWLQLPAPNLPITGLCLSDVLAVTGGTCLADAFTNANPAYFDATYAVAGGNWLDDFRNYGVSVSVPTVTTTAITAIAETTATGGGNVTADGGTSVTARGVCWNTSTNPTTANSHTTDGTGTGSFTSYLTSLSANTLYYVRAYATNSVGTSYGSNVTFTTNCRPGGLTDLIFYSQVNGVVITDAASADYYTTNFSCQSLCISFNGETLGGENNDVYLVWGATDCTKIGDHYYVMTTANGASKWAVYVTSGVLHYVYL